MSWKISLFIAILSLCACEQRKAATSHTSVSSPYLITAEELQEAYQNETIKLIDFRTKENYSNGHLPGALHLSRADIEDSTYAYTGMMASLSQLERLFSYLGIKTEDTIVIYDDVGLCNASRLWWILQNYNYTNVKMLHGGISAWESVGGKMSVEIPVSEKSNFKLDKPLMQFYVSKEDVLKALNDKTIVLDTRTIDEYVAKKQKKEATKAGRIPKSIHIDWAEAINYASDKCFKSKEDLEAIYGRMGADKKDPIIVYCHSGVRSAHTTFVLTQLLGYENVKNYDGSWTEWSYLDGLPFETDSITTTNNL